MGDQDTMGPEDASAKRAVPEDDTEAHRFNRWTAVPDGSGPDDHASKKAIPDDAGPDDATKKHV